MGWDLTTLGVITSAFPLAHACSKFASGVAADNTSPRNLVALGLLITGVLNIAFGAGNTVGWFAAVWALNGVFQGFGAPPCSKLLTNWYAGSERGRWWGVWNTSHNIGGFLIALLAATAAREFGWRAGMIVPGLIAIAMAGVVMLAVRDKPASYGLPSAERVLGEETAVAGAGAADDDEADGEELSGWAKIKEGLSNRNIWLLGMVYFCVYFVRQGVVNWGAFFLLDARGAASATDAAFRISGFEVGGLLANLSAGWLADSLQRRDPSAPAAGRRAFVIMLYLGVTAAALAALALVPSGAAVMSHWLAFAFLGHAIYGPQLLVAVTGAEILPKRSVASANGFLGWLSYMGAIFSGLPLTIAVRQHGWETYFSLLLAATAVAVVLCIPLLRVPSHRQVVAKQRLHAAQ